ncbi:hypothetical protein GLOIN_2v1766196 [Rhizophagus irregularis DAOM 181602=DAOM 197198]|nr:hypothetical protein GLOIN_2v1766196 [Rhizophagus irregularis DAOM 181602=DAOM 197198]
MSANLTPNIEIIHVLSQQMTNTSVRNKKTLAPAEGEIIASDHDFTKLSLTLSVTLFINIPYNISESFYNGKVYVCYKDAVSDFDMLTAVRTAPNHSWCNPAERIMSVINYGLQGVAIEREKTPNEFEDEFEIHEKATENSCLKTELEQSFETEIPASDSEINEMFENILRIDSTTKQQLCKHKSLVKFIETHCQERVYTFQCNQPTCEVCYPVRMPIDIFQNLYSYNSDHYEQFANLYGKPTTEQFCPSLINEKSKTELVPNNILIFAKIKDYIRYNSCRKTQCLYSNSQLTEQQKQDLNSVIQAYTY